MTDVLERPRWTGAVLGQVSEALREHVGPGAAIDRLEIRYVQAGPGGLVRAVFEMPRSGADVIRVSARHAKVEKGRRLEAEINERAADAAAAAGLDRAAFYLPGLELLLQVFPIDERLPSLATAADDGAMRSVLEGALAARTGGARLTSLSTRVVKYTPERKCVLRYDLTWSRHAGDAPSVVWARVSRRAKFERAAHTLGRVYPAARTLGFALPEPLGVVPDLAMELVGPVAGVQLFDLVDRPGFPALCRRTGTYLRQFHALPAAAADVFGIDEQVARVEENAEDFGWLMPDIRPRIERLSLDLTAGLRSLPRSTACFIHRDFHGGNVLADGDRLSLLDFEDCAAGEPADDIGSNWARLTRDALRDPDTRANVETGRAAFLEGYSLDSRTAGRLPVYAAMHGFLAAHQVLRHPSTDNADAARSLLAVCEQVLARGF